jgi:hypothetical protein
MIQKLQKILLLLLLAAGAGIYHRGSQNPTQLIPYPYLLADSSIKITERQQQEIDHSQLLIIGDQMAFSLNRYLPEMSKRVSQELSSQLKVFSWARSGEGVHRTIAKVRQLKKIPPIVIYMGGSQEQQEQKFHLSEKKKIIDNLNLERNTVISSLIMALPLLSKIAYTPIKYLTLESKLKEDTTYYDAAELQHLRVLSYRLYERELLELHQEVSSKGGILVVITSPANLELPPQRICLDFPTPDEDKTLKMVNQLLDKGDSKSAYTELKKLQHSTRINTQLNYLAGKVAISMGRFAVAQSHLKKAAIYDCGNKRGSPIYNIILKKFAGEQGVLLLDFDGQVNGHSRDNILFFDQVYPQPIFYHLLIDQLTNSITQLLQL